MAARTVPIAPPEKFDFKRPRVAEMEKAFRPIFKRIRTRQGGREQTS